MIYVLLLLIGVPIVEIYLFIAVGGEIGALRTVAIIILTAILGSYLLRREGLSILRELGEKSYEGESVSETLMQGVLVILAGVLLLTPGFLTDTIGFLMILPWTRRWLGRAIVNWFIGNMAQRFGSFFVHVGSPSSEPDDRTRNNPVDKTPRNDIIDADYEDVPPKKTQDKSGDKE